MKEEQIEALLDELSNHYTSENRKYEIGKKIESNSELKNALLDRVISVHYLSKDCGLDTDTEFYYHRRIQQSFTGEDIVDNYLYFQEEVAADPVVISINSQPQQNASQLLQNYFEALDKNGILSMKKSIVIHFEEIDKVYLQFIHQKKIVEIVEHFAPKMNNLQELSIRGITNDSGVMYVPLPNLKENTKLNTLSIDGFAFDALHGLSAKMPYLENLELSHSKRRDGSILYQMEPYSLSFSELGKLHGIRTLKLSSLGLSEIPNEIFSLRKLEKLDVSNNSIQELPSILQYKGLKTLVLDRNELTSTQNLPCITLRELSIKYNKVSKLDEPFVGLMAVNEMIFGGKEEVSIKMQGNQVTLESLPTQVWKDLGEIMDIEKIAKCVGLSSTEKEKLNNLFPSLSQNQLKSLTI